MTASVRIAASLWSVPTDELETRARALTRAGLPRWHWDHADGSLGPAGGFSPETADRLTTLTGLRGEAHLMVADPVAVVPHWLAACDTVVVHVEATGHQEALEMILRAGRTAAVAISPGTPVAELDALPDDVGVLVMSVEPGQAGSGFRPQTWPRLEALRGRRLLGVDGSVDQARAQQCLSHGATWVVSGTALCTSSDPAGWLDELRAMPLTPPRSASGAAAK